MVNGINPNNPMNAYINNSVRPSKMDMDAPAFLLQYDEKGVVWDRNEKEKEAEPQEPEKKGDSRQNAVVYEKSDYKKTTAAKTEKDSEPLPIKEFLDTLLGKIKILFANFLDFVWYGNDKESSEENIKTEELSGIKTEGGSQEHNMDDISSVDADTVIKDMIARHDMDGVVDVLTKNHTIHPARNSTLLTYYNRHGKIVDLGQTNTGRILHGDRHMKTM